MGWSQLHAHVYPLIELAPYADANAAVSIKGSPAAEWDRNTWLVLDDLARNHPDSGIHFQRKAAFTTEAGCV
jgi:D-amino-acid oxidase